MKRHLLISTPSPRVNRALARYRRWQRNLDRRPDRASRPRPDSDLQLVVAMAVCFLIAWVCLCLVLFSNIVTEQQILREQTRTTQTIPVP